MSGGFTDNPGKEIIRSKWDTPILKHLHDKHSIKYRYFGLPGPDLIDIKLWKDMISEVIAFEIPNTSGHDERASIKKMKKNLVLLESTYNIKTNAFFGPFEYIILNERDLEDKLYKQDSMINLYNLDFCNEITSKVPTTSGRNEVRFEALRQIFNNQYKCYRNKDEGPFLILLTARNEITACKIARDHLFPGTDEDTQLYNSTHTFVDKARRKQPFPKDNIKLDYKHSWVMKAFIYNMFRSFFAGYNIKCLFFPIVKYIGTPIDGRFQSHMIHWMMLCKYDDINLPAPRIYPQNILQTSTLSVSNKYINESRGPGEEYHSENDPLKIFKKYEDKFF